MAAMRLVLAAAVTALAALALAAGPDAPKPRPKPAAPLMPAAAPAVMVRTELRQQVREILLARPCRECHLGYLKTAVPKALKVFDLEREDWPATMEDRQLRALRGRLASGMSPKLGPEEAEVFDAGPGDLDTVDRFIQAELAARANPGK